MPPKPSASTILKTYSLDELLSLVKDKSVMEAEDKMQGFRNAIASLTGSATGGDAPKKRGPKPGSKRGRKPGPKPGSKRGRSKKSLKDYLLEVLGKEPMNIESIMDELKNKGYKSKSKDPRRVLYLELKKQVSSGNVKKAGRGMYALK